MLKNKMYLKFSALSINESFARLAVASFCSNESFNVEEISDIKTAVSEAVTNSIVHGYDGKNGEIEIECSIFDTHIEIIIIDHGIGIDNVNEAMQPFFTTKSDEEHSGMGFTLMDSFMSSLEVKPQTPSGLLVHMQKVIKG